MSIKPVELKSTEVYRPIKLVVAKQCSFQVYELFIREHSATLDDRQMDRMTRLLLSNLLKKR